MKLSSYCSHGLKMIVFYRGHAWLIFIRVIALWQFFKSKSCLCISSCSFQWILVKPSRYCCHDLKRIILYRGHVDCSLPELWPFVSLNHLSTEVLVSAFTTYWHFKCWGTLGLQPFFFFFDSIINKFSSGTAPFNKIHFNSKVPHHNSSRWHLKYALMSAVSSASDSRSRGLQF